MERRQDKTGMAGHVFRALRVVLALALLLGLAGVAPREALAAAKAPTVTVTRANTGKVTIKQKASYKLAAKASAGKLTYKSSKPKVVSVSKKGVVKGLKTGSATITITAKSGSKKTVKKVKVTVVAAKKYKQVKKLTAKAAATTLGIGKTTKVTATFTPKVPSNKNTIFKSSAPAVASVSATGVVTAKKAGKASITVTSCANAKAKATVTIMVRPSPSKVDISASATALTVGDEAQVAAAVRPNGVRDARVTYSSSDASVLEVDGGGKVIAKAPGTATVKASSVESPKVSATIEFSVKAQVTDPAPEPNAPGIGEAAYDERATTVDLTRADISEDGTGATVAAGVLRQAPAEGQVVVIADEGLRGTAIKVESVTEKADGSYDIKGTQPAFEEVFEDLYIDRVQGFTESDIVWMDEDVELVGVEEDPELSGQSEGVVLTGQSDGTIGGQTFKFKLTGDFWEKKGFGDTVTGKLNGELQIAATPLVDWELDYSGYDLTRLKVMPELDAKISGAVAMNGTVKVPLVTFDAAGTGVTLYLKAGIEGKYTLAYEVDVAAGIDWVRGRDGALAFEGSAEGSHQLSVEGRLGVDLQAKVALLCFEVGTLDVEAGGKAKGTLTKRSADLWCSDVNAWVFSEASYKVEDVIADLCGIDAKFTYEFWNASNSPLKTPKSHYENFERVDKCTWDTGSDPDDPDNPDNPDIPDIPGVDPLSSVDAYSWEELKAISNAIAAAQSDAEGLAIAQAYGLVDADGKLQGDVKSLTMKNDIEVLVRILGFRHDELSSGGLAGITFEFSNVVFEHVMNSDITNDGGWEASAMRSWLNGEFCDLLPDDLCACVVPVTKLTNNQGYVGSDDTTVVSETSDKLWLLSMTEVYGNLSDASGRKPMYPAVCDAEGTQYQLYADQGVTTGNYSFCAKSGPEAQWRLRSPVPANRESFFDVRYNGAYSSGTNAASVEDGVSPCFCF